VVVKKVGCLALVDKAAECYERHRPLRE